MRAIAPEEKLRVNTEIPILYEMSWTGEPGEWVVAPMEITEPAWGSAFLEGSYTKHEGGKHVAGQRVVYVANEPGEYEIPANVVRVAAGFVASPQTGPDGAETEIPPEDFDAYETGRLTIRVAREPWPIWPVVGAVLTVAFVLGLGLATRAATVRSRGTDDPDPSSVASVEEALHRAKRHRLDGDYYEFYRSLSLATALMPPSEAKQKLKKAFEASAKAVGYQNVQPTEDELDGAMRDFESALSRARTAAEHR